ncbi:hypothetical protein QK911_03100 [Lactococcus lactis]
MSDKGQINHTRSVVLDGITRYKEVKDNQFEVDLYFVAIDYLFLLILVKLLREILRKDGRLNNVGLLVAKRGSSS